MIQRQHIDFDENKDGWDCILKNEDTYDDILIEVHEYKAVVAFTDKDTGRTYAVLKCDKCGHPSISWSEDPEDTEEMSEGFIKQEIGG